MSIRRATPSGGSLYSDWIGDRVVPTLGTNAGAPSVAFQSWHHFKEAFSPELVCEAVRAVKPSSVFDPFGGSGTTALTAQFLGLDSTTVEINPFLADVIRARLHKHDPDRLLDVLGAVLRSSRSDECPASLDLLQSLPPTFVEPGVNGRWLFDLQVAETIASLVGAIDASSESHERLFFIAILGGMLAQVSNVVVSGKGRRYRRGWEDRRVSSAQVRQLFADRCSQAIVEVHRFADRSDAHAAVVTEDSRHYTHERSYQLSIFSPPYPNSFDYTDVYNLELWMLGYLRSSIENRTLRQSTLSSHVQIRREFAAPPTNSATLDRCLQKLVAVRAELWSRWIPEMVGAYFADLSEVLARLSDAMDTTGEVWMVVGDSKYAGITVPTAAVLTEMAVTTGWELVASTECRSMRGSAQQGRTPLPETLLRLRAP